ncbi:hypothetical protein [Nonomuraea rosea]
MRTACSDGGSSLPWSKARRKTARARKLERLERCLGRHYPTSKR